MSRVGAAAAELTGSRRMISLLAACAVLAGLAREWRRASTASHVAAAVVPFGFALALAAVVAAAVLATEYLDRLDVSVLALASVLFVVEHVAVIRRGFVGHTDESRLGRGALRLLRAGINPYSAAIPEHRGTHLLTGGVVTHYAYPPLMLEVGWLLSHAGGRLGEPWVVAELAVLATGIVAFAVLPRSVRALAVPVVYGFGVLDGYVNNGFPVALALPLLCLAARRWTAIGATGRLGRWGAIQAIALGLAAAAQQLAWFVAVLLVVALWVVRRGSLPDRRAALVTLRFAGITVAAFLAALAPFLVWDAGSALRGITAVFRQEAAPYGAGMVLLCIDVLGRCANFAFFTWATVLLALAAIAVTAAGVRRVGAAVPVLASLAFLCSSRSDVEYFVAFLPLWLVWFATTDRAALAAARPIGLPGRRAPVLTSGRRRSAAVVAMLLPALALTGVALATPAPLAMRVRSVIAAGAHPAVLVVTVTNRSSQPLVPRFSVGTPAHAHSWTPRGGTLRLAPGRTRTVDLVPTGRLMTARPTWRVSAYTAHPASLSTAPVPVHGRLHGHRRPPRHGPGRRGAHRPVRR